MPRPETHARTDAVEKAQAAFRAQGYERLGVRELGELTGVNRFALQTKFGGKQGLFIEVLQDYAEQSRQQLLVPLAAGGLDAIAGFFTEMTTPLPDDPRNNGCLMVNTVVENAGLKSPEIQAETDRHYKAMLDTFGQALQNARERGELDAGFNIVNGAAFLLTFAMGIQIYVRMKGQVSAAQPQTKVVLDTINSWRREPD